MKENGCVLLDARALFTETLLVKAAFFPLADKSYRAMAQMKKLQPEMMKLRERYEDDKVRMNQELMALYKKEKVNPISGCLPIVIQIPVFFALYKVLFVTIEMRHAPFYGWIHDLSAPDPTTLFNLFGLIPWTPPAFLMIGVWPIVMGITMFLQMQLNPAPTDPTQQAVFKFMPLIFIFTMSQLMIAHRIQILPVIRIITQSVLIILHSQARGTMPMLIDPIHPMPIA